ncbi:FAD-dependent oxidoreductase [Lactiplantibacillus argentoratensis]|uniref:FAD-dependent oxidoreductase n=1 Tax=Lactiplantibacillus argentoratensis TaxID=271881 RepID=UPI0021AAC2EF|nr:FAD-dependent oxidoreductase [Lactiplantibacillus argentoratensis]MCT4445071.1 FAD-dependent oxidoreductase [Lactiplantibacillus argentoratensis]
MKDGNYSEKAKGVDRPLNVNVKIRDGKIQEITNSSNDISDLEKSTLEKMSKRIINNQSLSVDAVSGATVSSKGIISAAKQAIIDSGGDVDRFAKKESKTKVNADNENYNNWIKAPKRIEKEIDTDLVIVGSGISGLSAAVQAGNDGINTIVLEKNGFVGGNGSGVEGMMGAETKMQKEAGITFKREEVVKNELETIQYQADGSFWVDLVNHTADNIDWLIKQGVQFDRVDDYHHTCPLPTFHWFKGGRGAIGYVPFMKKRAEELGVKIYLSSPVTGLNIEDKIVKGVYTVIDDKVTKVNAKAVIFASGGFGQNKELIKKEGWNTDNMLFVGMTGSTGDAYRMARAAGAKDTLSTSAPLITNFVQALPLGNGRDLLAGGPALWVNQDGVRFTDESITDRNAILQSQPFKYIKNGYLVFSRDMFAKYEDNIQDLSEEEQKSMKGIDEMNHHDSKQALSILDKSVKTNKGNSLFEASTLEELAEKVGLPKDNLVNEIKKYNDFCKLGEDKEFSKDKKYLVPIEKGPYYIARLDQSLAISIGGIGENRHFEVVDDNWNKIPGLYSAGIDSAMQYNNIYTINLGGSCCAHCVNSGRYSVKSAEDYISSNK